MKHSGKQTTIAPRRLASATAEVASPTESSGVAGSRTLAKAIRTLLTSENVETNRPAVDAGLAVLDAGGDFADGAIAYEGRWLGAEVFVSFDKHAVETLKAEGQTARLL